MYAPVYFAPHYFARSYFPGGAPVKPRYFHHGFFPAKYYPDCYFPGDAAVSIKPRYFLHSFFPIRWFADHYFPGDTPVLVPVPPAPTLVSVGGGAPFPIPHYVPPIEGIADLRLPVPELKAFGIITPARIEAHLQAALAQLQFQAAGQAAPAGITADGLALGLPVFTLSADGLAKHAQRRTQRSRIDDKAEEQLLLEHYLLTLKDES